MGSDFLFSSRILARHKSRAGSEVCSPPCPLLWFLPLFPIGQLTLSLLTCIVVLDHREHTSSDSLDCVVRDVHAAAALRLDLLLAHWFLHVVRIKFLRCRGYATMLWSAASFQNGRSRFTRRFPYNTPVPRFPLASQYIVEKSLNETAPLSMNYYDSYYTGFFCFCQ